MINPPVLARQQMGNPTNKDRLLLKHQRLIAVSGVRITRCFYERATSLLSRAAGGALSPFSVK